MNRRQMLFGALLAPLAAKSAPVNRFLPTSYIARLEAAGYASGGFVSEKGLTLVGDGLPEVLIPIKNRPIVWTAHDHEPVFKKFENSAPLPRRAVGWGAG